MDLRDDEKVIDFFLERELKSTSEDSYIRILTEYIREAGDGLTPTELILEAKREKKEIEDEDERTILKRFKRFKLYLKKKPKLTNETRKHYISSIRTFYTTLNVKEVPTTTFKVPRKKQLKKKDLSTQEEVKTAVLDGRKYQAVLLIAASSGLYGGDIRELKLNQFLESFNKQAGTYFNGISDIDEMIKVADKREIVIKWEKDRHKNGIEQMTFSSPEATRSILQYLRKNPQKDPDGYLFHWKGEQIRAGTFKGFLTDLNNRLQIKEKYKRINFLNLRKRFGGIIEPKVSYRQGQYLLGHVPPPVDGSYFKLPGEREMREAYLNALPELMILEPVEVRVLTDEKLRELENVKKEVVELQNDLKGVFAYLDREGIKLPKPPE